MIKIEAKILGDLAAAITRAVEAFTTRQRDLLEGWGRRVQMSIRRNIDERRTPDGNPWPAFKDPLHASGFKGIRDGISYQLMMPGAVAIGDTTTYGKFQNDGTAHIPARTFIGIRPEDDAAMQDELTTFIHDVFESS
jgi:hypothetical protein